MQQLPVPSQTIHVCPYIYKTSTDQARWCPDCPRLLCSGHGGTNAPSDERSEGPEEGPSPGGASSGRSGPGQRKSRIGRGQWSKTERTSLPYRVIPVARGSNPRRTETTSTETNRSLLEAFDLKVAGGDLLEGPGIYHILIGVYILGNWVYPMTRASANDGSVAGHSLKNSGLLVD